MPRSPEVFTFAWRDVTIRVEHIRDWRIDGWSRLIVRVVSPHGAPLPFAEDGYFVHQLDENTLTAAGGVVAFLITWMERDAVHPRYAQAIYKWNQRDLFR